MISEFVPCKKMRRNSKFLLFATILVVGVVAVYNEMLILKVRSSNTSMIFHTNGSSWWRFKFDERIRRDYRTDSLEESAALSFTPQAWKPEYKGKANLHAFDDWCGSSIADLFRNIHYPLFPHVRTTVQKLAVSPQLTNHGLRIFGYLHPDTDGDYEFALGSDDNSEFWLSRDDSPLNVQLLMWVGKTGAEWTAPGEFDKYPNQTSRPIRLSAQRKYFFEVIHQQNEEGTDHVEVAWRHLDQDLKFQVIESKHISLYVDESAFLPSDVAHIPQTAASYKHPPTKQHSAAADMLKEDPRDTFHRVPLINSKFLQGVLPNCLYKPSYTIKGFPLSRYQGLHFVHMSYVYPNDYTRLTHMETQASCFYPDSSKDSKRFSSSKYMTLDRPDNDKKGDAGKDFGTPSRNLVLDGEEKFDYEDYQREEETRPDHMDEALFLEYGDINDNSAQKRKLLSIITRETNNMLKNISDSNLHKFESQRKRGKSVAMQRWSKSRKPVEPLRSAPTQTSEHHLQLQQNQTAGQVKKVEQVKRKGKLRRQKLKSVETAVRAGRTNIKTSIPVERVQRKAKKRPGVPSEQLSSKQYHIQTQNQRLRDSKPRPKERDVPLLEKPTVATQQSFKTRDKRLTTRLHQRETDGRKHLRDKEIEMNMPLQEDVDKSIATTKIITTAEIDKNQADRIEEEVWEEDEVQFNDLIRRDTQEDEKNSLWDSFKHFESPGDTLPVVDPDAKWRRTFQFSHQKLHAMRPDDINLNCNISGNLLIPSSEALPLVKAFMDQLNKMHSGQFTLVRVINVVKHVDRVQGNRYLLELELKDVNGQLLRLSQYIYTLSSQRSNEFPTQPLKPQLMLCNPVGFQWNPAATVHFIVPVKNQARWVAQMINDMERLFRDTQDTNFNLIITDFSSTDMDVRKALQKSSLPRYEYVKLSGNFERSAGLQAGIDLIEDAHSIVFLCDLHIHFPSSIIDVIRKSCVEGYMAFTPIVMRLNCGATPSEARVNGPGSKQKKNLPSNLKARVFNCNFYTDMLDSVFVAYRRTPSALLAAPGLVNYGIQSCHIVPGYWENNGFGLLGIYKSDLDAVGGMNTQEYKDRWGGEDWELLDRILQTGLEVERIYLRNFFHYFHSRRGMWNQPSHR